MAIPSEILALRDACCLIEGVSTSSIGVESAMSPADYPMVRIVPVRFTPGPSYDFRNCEVSIYFGANLADSQGLDDVYDCTLAIEKGIIDELYKIGGTWVETLTDEDRLQTYKLMFIRANIPCARV